MPVHTFIATLLFLFLLFMLLLLAVTSMLTGRIGREEEARGQNDYRGIGGEEE